MSKITRRDFLKTAGVMTLAVAAAGVLSGCEGNKEPVLPETGNKVLGDVTKVGDIEFSVSKAVLAQTKGKFDPKTGVQKEPTNRKLGLIFTVKNTNKNKLDNKFDFTNVKVRVNGKALTGAFAPATDSLKAEVYGLTGTIEKAAGETAALPYNEKATAYQYVVDCQPVKGEYADSEEALQAINKIEVIVNDEANLVYTTYEIAVPAAKDYDKSTEYYTV